MEFVDQAIAYMRDGFGIVNGDWRNLVIALIAAIFMSSWKQWIPFAVLAVVAHIAIEKLAPVLTARRTSARRTRGRVSRALWTIARTSRVGHGSVQKTSSPASNDSVWGVLGVTQIGSPSISRRRRSVCSCMM